MKHIERIKSLLRSGDYQEVIDLTDSVPPGFESEWNHCMAIAHANLGELQNAAVHWESAKAISSNALYCFNLGRVYQLLGDFEKSECEYRESIQHDPNGVEALSNLGSLLAARGNNESAIEYLQKATEVAPENATGFFNLANSQQDIGDFESAERNYRIATQLDPSLEVAYENLGRALIDQQRHEDARLFYSEWLERDADNPIAKHHLAALQDDEETSRCSDEYVRATFNEEFAEHFESQLAKLTYRAPQLLVDALFELSAGDEAPSYFQVLDLGCGTGLVAELIRPYANELCGVDLSEHMIEKAREKRCYDELIAQEAVAHLSQRTQHYDLILSADTFCYFGELSELVESCFHSLKNRGCLAFTVELEDDANASNGFRLRPHGRFSHTQEYVCALLEQSGFSEVSASQHVLRKEIGLAVEGLVILAIKQLDGSQSSIVNSFPNAT